MFMKNNNSTRVINPDFKMMGMIILIFGMASIVFKEYWEPLLANYLFSAGLSGSDVKYYMYLIGFYPMVCVAVGGYLMYRSREKPLRPSQEDIDEGKL